MHDTNRRPDQIVEQTLNEAVRTTARTFGRPDLPAQLMTALHGVDDAFPHRLDRQLHLMFDQVIRTAMEHGWQPADLAEYGRRKLESQAGPLLIDVVAAEQARYADATTDPGWRDQLTDLGAQIWWDAGRPHFPQWVQRHGLDRPAGLRTAVSLAGFLLALPRLPRLLPLPGTATARETGRGTTARAGVDAKVLTRIRALLAKAESTEFPDEAEALSGKAQELMAKFSLDRALVEAEAGPSELAGGPSARRIWVEPPYMSAKTHLVSSVATANRCRAVSDDQLGFVTVLGTEVDMSLVEVLVTSLLLQAGRAMLQAGRRTGRSGESRTRSFRQSFLVSYAIRIGERLRAAARATEEAMNRAEPGRLLPVLARRDEAVDRLFAELFPKTVRRGVRVSNAEGWAAGRSAADLARFDTSQALPS